MTHDQNIAIDNVASRLSEVRTEIDATAQKKKPRSHREMRPGFVMRRSALFAAATLTALRSSG